MKRSLVYLLFAALLFLAACAPAADPGRIEIQQLTQPISFYPRETGAVWTYLPDGPRDAPPVYQRVEGPTSIEGQLWIAWRLFGRGFDIYSYRQYRDDGVFLLREIRPGTQITFNPPLKELPSQAELRVGASWSGETTAHLYFPQATPQNQRSQLTLNYRYNIVDRRSVAIEAGSFDVYIINFESDSRDEAGDVVETIRQEMWFSPYVGEVRNKFGFFLVDTNFATDGTRGGR